MAAVAALRPLPKWMDEMQGETASATARSALREWRAARVDASAAEMAMKCVGERQDALNALVGAAQAAASLTKI